jgi:uncharacterized protein (TIGR03492 family)
MTRVLFVSNGHGEVAIAARIAEDLAAQSAVTCDHLALVGDFAHPSVMRDVGPRRVLPSGGLIAMGNTRNIARDIRAGLLAHTFAQLRFLRSVRGTYAASIAVGDVFALLMTLRAHARTVFVGTAKSVHVAPYGPIEERLIRTAKLVYVRDEATAKRLQSHGIAAHSANVIVDLYAQEHSALEALPFTPRLAIFPGSRQSAYADAVFQCAVVRELARTHDRLGAVLSIAPGLDPERMAHELEQSGLHVARRDDDQMPFSLIDGDRELVRAWRGSIGAMLSGTGVVLGQAGTANEAAAAAGIPVVAFARSERSKTSWYRHRQAGLLGDALRIVSGDGPSAAQQVAALIADGDLRARMAATGRERMGAPGAAHRIARGIAELIA